MTLLQSSAWLQTLANVIWTVGIAGLLAGWALQRYADHYGRAALAKLAPTVCAAIVIALVLLLAKEGVLKAPHVAATTQPVISPYCDGWLYYIDPSCWVQ